MLPDKICLKVSFSVPLCSPLGPRQAVHSDLNLKESLFVGGAPDYSKLARAAGLTEGFKGTVQKVKIGALLLPVSFSLQQWWVVIRPPLLSHRPSSFPEGSCSVRRSDLD